MKKNEPCLASVGNNGEKIWEIKSFLEKQGTPRAHDDLQIASIVLSMDMTLITGNLKHFQRVPLLIVENWLI